MNERNLGSDTNIPHTENAFTEAPSRYRSEARSERAGRISRLFSNEPAPSSTAAPTAGAGGTIIYTPSTYEDVQLLIDHLKRREQVIVDFSKVNRTSVYRILDFMSGAIYALNGSIQQITTNIFLFAPSGVTISVPPVTGRK